MRDTLTHPVNKNWIFSFIKYKTKSRIVYLYYWKIFYSSLLDVVKKKGKIQIEMMNSNLIELINSSLLIGIWINIIPGRILKSAFDCIKKLGCFKTNDSF